MEAKHPTSTVAEQSLYRSAVARSSRVASMALGAGQAATATAAAGKAKQTFLDGMMTLSKAEQQLLGDTLLVIRQLPLGEEELEMLCLRRINFGCMEHMRGAHPDLSGQRFNVSEPAAASDDSECEGD